MSDVVKDVPLILLPILPLKETSSEVKVDPKIRFLHFRYHDNESKTKQNVYGINNRGGVTVAYQRSLDFKTLKYAFTLCSLKDNFSRYTGRMIAQCYLENDEEHYMINCIDTAPNSAYLQGKIMNKIIQHVSVQNPKMNLYKNLW